MPGPALGPCFQHHFLTDFHRLGGAFHENRRRRQTTNKKLSIEQKNWKYKTTVKHIQIRKDQKRNLIDRWSEWTVVAILRLTTWDRSDSTHETNTHSRIGISGEISNQSVQDFCINYEESTRPTKMRWKAENEVSSLSTFHLPSLQFV